MAMASCGFKGLLTDYAGMGRGNREAKYGRRALAHTYVVLMDVHVAGEHHVVHNIWVVLAAYLWSLGPG
jgi:hypothetical protein